MAYVKNIWVDQDVERPKTYEVTNNQDGSITLTDSFGIVTELGTPVNATNMNHIEDGLADTDCTKYNAATTYNTGEWVTGFIDNEKAIYVSLTDNNLGNPLSDDTKWEKVEMGGGSTRNIGEIVASTIPLTDAGLHLLDGALMQYGSYEAFIDYIADVYENTKTYNPNAFTIVGSPTITSDGIASGFSSSNKVKVPYTFQSPSSFTIKGSFTFPSTIDTSAKHIVLGIARSGSDTFFMEYRAISGNVGVLIYSNGASSHGSLEYSLTNELPAIPDKTYNYTITVSGTSITLNVEGVTKSANNFYTATSTDYYVGCDRNGSNNFPGSLDLKQYSVTVGGVEVFSGTSIADFFCSESDWQTAVSTYGVCGKFVYDSTNSTVRLPKYNDKIYTGGGTAGVVGNGNSLGWTNGTDFGYCTVGGNSGSVFLKSDTVQTVGTTNTTSGHTYSSNYQSMGITPDLTKSGIIANLASITTALDGFYYIVVATSTKTNIQVDIDEIATDLNGKADVDLTNVNNAGYIKMAGASMPSNTKIVLTLGASDSTYIAPANGYFTLRKQGNTGQYIAMACHSSGVGLYSQFSASNTYAQVTIPVKKNDEVVVFYSASGATQYFNFIYAVGSESEAS